MKCFSLKTNLILVCILFFTAAVFGQKSESLWSKTTQSEVFSKKPLYQQNEPIVVSYYKLNLEDFKSTLQNVPQRWAGNSSVILNFPTVDGQLESFKIEESSNFSPELQAQFPEIRSFIGHGITNPRAILRFSISPDKGLSSMVLSDKKTVFIEPYSADLTTYRVYIRTAQDIRDTQFICETEPIAQNREFDDAVEIASRNANDGKLRTFRLALACTGEYATFHGGTVAGVMAAMNASLTRVNGIFERDVAIRMVLVPNNSNVIFLNAGTDPYTNNSGSTMLNQNQTTCNNNIGVSNYDIGHVFSTGGGGIAQLNSPCGSGKARGVTGSSSPVGDTFDIDYVAHEMGHQYGGNHTQNNSCQRSSKSYEPGSASTIMGYAGICAPNVQGNSDDYFHGESIREMWTNISAGASQCGAQSNTGNAAPIANAGSDYTIPKSTPFVLKGAATDANSSNSLTYCWEQLDATPATMPPASTSTSGPAFRSKSPVASPDRYMPPLATVLNGSTSTTWEVVPSVGRTMNFNLTVRDNFGGGASTSSDGMIVTTAGTAGPFVVTSQNSNVTWQVGSTQTVTWNVANTNIAPVNTENVNIRLSTDGGVTFPIVLASGVPNNGANNITVPQNVTNQARILVEGAGNIFYNVNSSNFQIVTTEFFMDFANTSATVCQPSNALYNFTYTTFNGFSETTTFSVTGLPAGANVEFLPGTASANGTSVTMTISNTNAVAPGSYAITVVGTAASTTKTTSLTLNIFSASLSASTLTAPANGSIGESLTPTLTWSSNPVAQSYLVQVATDPNFTNIVNSASVTTPSYVASLVENTLYYWRVTASNACATSPASSVFSFTTLDIQCNTYASATNLNLAIPDGTGTTSPVNGQPITHIINVPDSGTITNITVNVDVSHPYVSDLLVSITHPDGVTAAVVWSGNCGSNDNFDVTFSDTAGAITCGSPTVGTFLPNQALSVFNDLDPAGDWEILIADFFAQDVGSLNDWSLNICYEPTLSVVENEISEFLIFPNPNQGEFTIKLNSSTDSKIKVDVYDIRGRLIYNNSYQNNSNFKQTISLDNVQSGMYLVKVSDGEKSTTKKIIIE